MNGIGLTEVCDIFPEVLNIIKDVKQFKVLKGLNKEKIIFLIENDPESMVMDEHFVKMWHSISTPFSF